VGMELEERNKQTCWQLSFKFVISSLKWAYGILQKPYCIFSSEFLSHFPKILYPSHSGLMVLHLVPLRKWWRRMRTTLASPYLIPG
jgi:hypothetical protein